MTRDKLLEHSLGSVARQISDAQPGALADAMEALERQRKLLSPLTEAARLAGGAIENPALSIAKGMEHALGLPDIATRNELEALHGAVGIKNDLAKTARQLKDHLGVDPSILNGDLSLRKAASGAIGEINGLQDAIKAATGSLNVLEEHKRMSDLLDTAQPYRGTAYGAAADALSTVSAPSARSVPAAPSRSGGARKKVTSAKAIGELVREARRKMKLSQQDFADLAGVGRRFVSELEAGKPTLEFDKVMQACAAAGIDVTAASRSAS